MTEQAEGVFTRAVVGIENQVQEFLLLLRGDSENEAHGIEEQPEIVEPELWSIAHDFTVMYFEFLKYVARKAEE